MIDRIQKLIALALNNPSEAEAHAAAMKALRLIVEHKVRLVLDVPRVPPFTPRRPFYPSQAQHDWWYRTQPPAGGDPYNKQQRDENAQRQAEDRRRYMDDLIASMLGKRP